MGHVRNYTIGDVMSRFHRMRGYNVMQPMGWDAFGLPAENAAMANGVPPAKWTYDNIGLHEKAAPVAGFAIDWSQRTGHCEPGLLPWNQWLFLRLLERGLAYKKDRHGELGSRDQTARQEHVIDGRGWRTGAPVESARSRCTTCASPPAPTNCRVVATLRLARARENHARPTGSARASASTSPSPYTSMAPETAALVHTRADTLMGATFCAVAPEHPLAAHAARAIRSLRPSSRNAARQASWRRTCAAMEKKGMPTGCFVSHPLSGERVQVWVGNDVLMSYAEAP